MEKLLAEMEKYAAENNVPVINRESAKILAGAVAVKKPLSVLEIGTAIGYSALLMACNMPYGGKITTIELDPARAEIARQFIARAGLLDRTEIVIGDAAAVLERLAGPFDCVFIDAAKGQYLHYLLQVLPKLAPAAVIIADNVLFRGWVNGGQPPRRYKTIVERLRKYLAFVSDDPRFKTVIHSVGDGVSVSTYQGEVIDEED